MDGHASSNSKSKKKVLGEVMPYNHEIFANTFSKKKKRNRRLSGGRRRKACSENRLPAEVWVRVFAFCDPETVANLRLTCSRFYNIIRGSGLRWLRPATTPNLASMPSEIVLAIFQNLDRADLGRCAQVCHRFRDLTSADYLWLAEGRHSLVTNGQHADMKTRSFNASMSAQDRVRVSRNWTRGCYAEVQLLIQNTRYMPRVQLASSRLWVSWGNQIWVHERRPNGTIYRTATKVLRGHTNDVSRFIVKDGVVVSGGLDKTLVGWRVGTGNQKAYDFAFARRYCHGSEVSAVDVTSRGSVILSGSRDETVKTWRFSDTNNTLSLMSTLRVGDRIWSLGTSECGTNVAIGTAGLRGVPSLILMDLATGNGIRELGRGLRNGAGMLDIVWHDRNNFLSCGYDSITRLWDIRSGQCVRKWEEPFNEAIYCMATDNNVTLVCGSARHGLVRLWDMRSEQPVQMFYVKHPYVGTSSPVYSVAFDELNLYVALDQSLNLLSFYGHNNRSHQKLIEHFR